MTDTPKTPVQSDEEKRVDFLLSATDLFPSDSLVTSHLRLSASELASKCGQRVHALSCFKICEWCGADRKDSKTIVLPATKRQRRWKKKNKRKTEDCEEKEYVFGGRTREDRNVVKWICHRCGKSSQVSLAKPPAKEKYNRVATPAAGSSFFIDRVPCQRTPESSRKRPSLNKDSSSGGKKRKFQVNSPSPSVNSTPPLSVMKQSQFRNKKLANLMRQNALDREKQGSSLSMFLQTL